MSMCRPKVHFHSLALQEEDGKDVKSPVDQPLRCSKKKSVDTGKEGSPLSEASTNHANNLCVTVRRQIKGGDILSYEQCSTCTEDWETLLRRQSMTVCQLQHDRTWDDIAPCGCPPVFCDVPPQQDMLGDGAAGNGPGHVGFVGADCYRHHRSICTDLCSVYILQESPAPPLSPHRTRHHSRCAVHACDGLRHLRCPAASYLQAGMCDSAVRGSPNSDPFRRPRVMLGSSRLKRTYTPAFASAFILGCSASSLTRIPTSSSSRRRSAS